MHYTYFQIFPKISNEKHSIGLLNDSFYSPVQRLVLIFFLKWKFKKINKFALLGIHRTQTMYIDSDAIHKFSYFIYKVKYRPIRRRSCHGQPCLNLPAKALAFWLHPPTEWSLNCHSGWDLKHYPIRGTGPKATQSGTLTGSRGRGVQLRVRCCWPRHLGVCGRFSSLPLLPKCTRSRRLVTRWCLDTQREGAAHPESRNGACTRGSVPSPESPMGAARRPGPLRCGRARAAALGTCSGVPVARAELPCSTQIWYDSGQLGMLTGMLAVRSQGHLRGPPASSSFPTAAPPLSFSCTSAFVPGCPCYNLVPRLWCSVCGSLWAEPPTLFLCC